MKSMELHQQNSGYQIFYIQFMLVIGRNISVYFVLAIPIGNCTLFYEYIFKKSDLSYVGDRFDENMNVLFCIVYNLWAKVKADR